MVSKKHNMVTSVQSGQRSQGGLNLTTRISTLSPIQCSCEAIWQQKRRNETKPLYCHKKTTAICEHEKTKQALGKCIMFFSNKLITCLAILSDPSSISPFSHSTNPPYMLRQALPEPCLLHTTKEHY